MRWPYIAAGILIAALVVLVVIPRSISWSRRTICGKARPDLHAIHGALCEYAIRHGGRWPETLDPLVVPDEHEYTLLDMRSLPVDPWRRPYRYERPTSEDGENGRIYTLGEDGKPGGTGPDRDVVYRLELSGEFIEVR
jgi:hypothetical protein